MRDYVVNPSVTEQAIITLQFSIFATRLWNCDGCAVSNEDDMKKINFDEAIERIENGENPLSVLEMVQESDKDAVRDYLNAFSD